MAKYKVLNRFIDKETKETYEVGNEIELTVKRADEVSKALDDGELKYLSRIEEVSKESTKKTKDAKSTEKK